ncbi:hypothetical protein [Marinobacter sp.]|uniref:hypothetical protein n=1 Tax=Marinobacter sp. TaxID=50741 RepID=UPI002E85B60C|nr:hypothetical protein [Pseudomonadota bacterium]MEE3116998.1 hypothetical protein [Pseudomonadota bacterium]
MKALKRTKLYPAIVLAHATLASTAVHAAKYEFHGDMNNRFQAYSNQRDWFNGSGLTGKEGALKDDGKTENFGELKYRFWFEAATNNDEVRGVYATEIGGIRYGEGSGGDFSGDGTNVETRWAYVDFGVPSNLDHRIKMGLQPITVDKHLWNETATGVMAKGPLTAAWDYQFLWGRGDSSNENAAESDDDGFDGADNFALNLNGQVSPGLNIGGFLLYQVNDQISEGTGSIDSIGYELKAIADNSKYDVTNVGGTFDFRSAVDDSEFFLKGTAIYQTGTIEGVNFTPLSGATNPNDSYDLGAYFLRGDIGIDIGATTFTYTLWYSSGDDDATDDNFDAFIATDVDINESMIFQENFTDDDYFAETAYLLDKGYLMNKFQVDHKLSHQVTISGIAIYNALAEDVTLGDGSEDNSLGFEFGGRLTYKPNQNLEIAAEAAYLVADDAMDAFEEAAIQDGDADENITHIAGRVRYKF